MVIRIPPNVVAALGPHVDGVDPRKREWPVTELWDDVGFLDRRQTDAGAGSHELAGILGLTTTKRLRRIA